MKLAFSKQAQVDVSSWRFLIRGKLHELENLD